MSDKREKLYLRILDSTLEENVYSREAKEIESLLRRYYKGGDVLRKIRNIKRKHKQEYNKQFTGGVPSGNNRLQVYHRHNEFDEKKREAAEVKAAEADGALSNEEQAASVPPRKDKKLNVHDPNERSESKPQTVEEKIDAAVEIEPLNLYNDLSSEEMVEFFDKDTRVVRGYAEHYGFTISKNISRYYTAINHLLEAIEDKHGIIDEEE